jgi:hypothetical protein
MTHKFRLRDRQETKLTQQNVCRNDGNERQKTARSERKWLDVLELQKLIRRAWKLFELRNHTIGQVCQALALFGDVRPSQPSRARLAKSVLDASWSHLGRMGRYKSICSGGRTLAIAERPSSQLCSAHWAFPPSGSKGIEGPFIRLWRSNGRVNAARDVAVMGLDRGGTHV